MAFVDSLATHLDDHAARGAELAARLHLSRFHFDRIMSPVAGEPPARFRRRVLLERAAYRLVTCDRSVLDVAVEAGYSSHEAFTRAFRAPTACRRCVADGAAPDPARHARARSHFHPPGSLRLPARDKVTAMDLLTQMVEHHIWLIGEMIDLRRPTDRRAARPADRGLTSTTTSRRSAVAAVPADRPDGHVELPRSRSGTTTGRSRSTSPWPPCASGSPRVGAGLPRRTSSEVVEQDRLDDTFVDALCEPAEVFTYGGMIAHVLTFAAHNRTLVVLALEKAGIEDLGWGDPMTWVAEPV